ncbi:MAG: CHAT domain-containing protein [Saprospiraceae bacterium]|nr:CHAT domain-containing protein [Candidatus Vicinibacter affinis]
MRYLILILLVVCTNSLNAQTIDSVAIKQVDSLIQVSRELTGKKDFDQALVVNAAAEKIALEVLGRESAACGSCALNRGRVNHFKGNYPEAEKWYQKSKEIREKTLGREHPDYANNLNSLAVLYQSMHNFEKAEPLYLESKAIREKVLGKEHPDYAASLNNLGKLYEDMGNYEKAEALFLEAKAMGEKVLGKEHPDYGWRLTNLGVLYFTMGNYEKAEPLYLEAAAIHKKVLGVEHPDYATSLNNLAGLYQVLGKYEKAEPLLLEAKDIRGKVLGVENPDYAGTLINLATLYSDMGNYQKAELLYLEAKNIFKGNEKLQEHPFYMNCLNNLALLYQDLGNYEKAEPLYLEVKAIREKVLGTDHPDYATSLNNLASLYRDLGKYEKAEPLHLEAKTIDEKALGKEHPSYANSMSNLGNLYIDMGNYENAELLLLEAKAIREKELGKEHPDYATSLGNLALLYQYLGNYEKAEPLYLEAKDIDAKIRGKEHPLYAWSLNSLADLYERQNLFSNAGPLLEEALANSQSRLVNATSFLSEQELAKYAVTFQKSGDNLSAYLLARQAAEAEPGILPTLAYDHALFYKGFLLTAASRLNAPTIASSETMEINLRLKGYRRRLSAEYSKPIAERKGIAELEEKANLAEKELARTVAGYAEALRQVKWQDVQATLKQTDAAIEFISFKVNFPKTTDSITYAALLLKAGDKQPHFIPLFEKKKLTKLLSDNKESNLITALYASRGVVPINEESFRGLHDLFFKPLAPFLQGTKTIYYSPAGLLHRFNFDAIPIDEKTKLSDKFKLVRLGSTRSLVVPDLTKVDSSNQVLLFGGINYNIDTTSIGSDSIKINLLSSKGDELSFLYAARGIKERGNEWGYLPGTEQEINGVSKLFKKSKFKTADFSGTYATEEAFKNIGKSASSPRVLHLSTHGFFFPDPNEKKGNKQLAIDNEQNEPAFKMSDHPMIRSGLILAGGNYAWKEGKPFKEGMEDGILTAYEISQMNLSNTELVVLSACETGLGDIQGNEGVYGLQRAFKIAGAKYLMMSLWQVPDEETKEFMISFYKNWLNKKLSIPDAFRTTQNEMRQRYSNPYLWAGFVLVE